jgi:hypothetical protein
MGLYLVHQNPADNVPMGYGIWIPEHAMEEGQTRATKDKPRPTNEDDSKEWAGLFELFIKDMEIRAKRHYPECADFRYLPKNCGVIFFAYNKPENEPKSILRDEVLNALKEEFEIGKDWDEFCTGWFQLDTPPE